MVYDRLVPLLPVVLEVRYMRTSCIHSLIMNIYTPRIDYPRKSVQRDARDLVAYFHLYTVKADLEGVKLAQIDVGKLLFLCRRRLGQAPGKGDVEATRAVGLGLGLRLRLRSRRFCWGCSFGFRRRQRHSLLVQRRLVESSQRTIRQSQQTVQLVILGGAHPQDMEPPRLLVVGDTVQTNCCGVEPEQLGEGVRLCHKKKKKNTVF